MRWTVLAALALTMVACRARPKYEYEPPITITHTDDEAAPVTSTTVPGAKAPSRPSSWVRGGTK